MIHRKWAAQSRLVLPCCRALLSISGIAVILACYVRTVTCGGVLTSTTWDVYVPSDHFCPRACSGRGLCDRLTHTCECFPGFAGGACESRSCPVGPAWVAPVFSPYSADVEGLHSGPRVECAGVGDCDRFTGKCTCRPGFAGPACEMQSCPSTPAGVCNGQGVCMSAREAAQLQGVAYASPWDAERARGCLCNRGWTGYDCSRPECPKAQDPVETPAHAVHSLSCTCIGACGQQFTLTLPGSPLELPTESPALRAGTVVHAASELDSPSGAPGSRLGESLESILNDALNLPVLSIYSASIGQTVCADGNTTVTSVTFKSSAGDPPALIPMPAAWNGAITWSITTHGSVAKPCAGRGSCHANTGACLCGDGYGPSDGDGGAGHIADCAHLVAASHACPTSVAGVACSGHGVCSGAAAHVCTCEHGWTGSSCAYRRCEMHTAWWDVPTGPSSAHAPAVCSNKGTCDSDTGWCLCAAGYAGNACERSVCPVAADGRQCSGRGHCVDMRTWLKRFTVQGSRPGRPEIQSFVCGLDSASAASFYVLAGHMLSVRVLASASPADLEQALDAILMPQGMVGVQVRVLGTALCDASSPVTVELTIPDVYGNAPDLRIVQIDDAGVPGTGMAAAPGAMASAAFTAVEEQSGARAAYGGAVPPPAATWMSEKLMMCSCDGYPDSELLLDTGDLDRYTGTQCQLQRCPVGRDPHAVARAEAALQGGSAAAPAAELVCSRATAGSFFIVVDGVSTPAISSTDSAASVKASVEATLVGRVVSVTFSAGAAVCSAAGTVRTIISFDAPVSRSLPEVSVQRGTLVCSEVSVAQVGYPALTECAGRGICDREHGVCKCFTHYTSSDGRGRRGQRGDCGWYNEEHTAPQSIAWRYDL